MNDMNEEFEYEQYNNFLDENFFDQNINAYEVEEDEYELNPSY